MMRVIHNAYVTKDAAYNSAGGIIAGTQRITTDHTMKYWQQENDILTLSIDIDERVQKSPPIFVQNAYYLGRIPIHFGHFITEGLPKICMAPNTDIPLVGVITRGVLPPETRVLPLEDIIWVISHTSTVPKNREILEPKNDDSIYCFENLYVSEPPYYHSHSAPNPQSMSLMISNLVRHARKQNTDVGKIESLYLRKDNEVFLDGFEHTLSDTHAHISKQIAMISYAKTLLGLVGSNTHASIFAHRCAKIQFDHNGEFEKDRNQAICDLVRTFNDYGEEK